MKPFLTRFLGQPATGQLATGKPFDGRNLRVGCFQTLLATRGRLEQARRNLAGPPTDYCQACCTGLVAARVLDCSKSVRFYRFRGQADLVVSSQRIVTLDSHYFARSKHCCCLGLGRKRRSCFALKGQRPLFTEVAD